MTDCHCPVPFTEDDYICRPCELAEQELYERLNPLPPEEADDDLDAAFPEAAFRPR